MKTLKSRMVKSGDFKGERLKLVQFTEKEQKENNGDKFAVAFGEYNDIDFSCETQDEAESFYKNWEN